jgi:sec-independent protein translocase protein TatA
MPFNLSMGELLVLLVVSILLFGGRLPEVARTIGQTISSFKRGMSAEMSRLDLDLRGDLRGRDVPPYRPAPHLNPTREPPEDPADENCEAGGAGETAGEDETGERAPADAGGGTADPDAGPGDETPKP